MSLLETKTVSSVSVIPFALMFGVISAVIGLVMGIIYAAVFGTVISSAPISSELFNFSWLSILLGVGAVIIMPVIGFAAGFIQGAIYAVLYNVLAPKIGGIKLQFKTEEQTPNQP